MSAQRVYRSPFPPFRTPHDLSITQFLLASNPDDVSHETPIFSDFNNPSHGFSFGGLRKLAAQGAAGLGEIVGLGDGDVVCIYGQNSVNWSLLSHSVMWAGACSCGLNPLATSYELAHYLDTAKPKVIAVDTALLSKVEEALKHMKLRTAPVVIVIHDHLTPTTTKLPRFPQDFISNGRKPMAPYDLTKKDNTKVPAAMCFSSGTSGVPKGVVLSHHNLIAYLLMMRATSPFIHSSNTKEVFFPSYAHIYGLIAGVLLPAFVGCYTVAMGQFEFIPYLTRCAEIRATVLRLVPTTAVRITKDPDVRKLDLKSVHTLLCAGASLASETVQGLQHILSHDVKVINGYGMSEAAVTMLREEQSHRAGSVGKPSSGVSLRIVDDTFNDVPAGMEGECILKGPTVFMEYKGNPAATAETFHDGWLCTGDIVRADEDDFIWITGRKKELIKFKGNQIAPVELEAILLSHPLVTEAGVCGIATKEKDSEVPLGCVALASSVEARDIEQVLAEIKAFVEERVAPYKRLRGGLFHMETLPKTSTGKIMRRKLPELVTERRGPKASKL